MILMASSLETPAGAIQSGVAAASAPNAPARAPIRLYRAKARVRSTAATAPESTVCSRGTKTLVLPPEGLMVPTNPIARVRSADPSSASVATTPTSKADSPSAVR